MMQLSLRPRNDTIRSMKGVVTCDAAPCSDAGALMLKRGGNAVDAAIATALCLGVVSPTESGIGGGSFMIIRLANSRSIAIDMREVAPAAASTNMFKNNPQAQVEGPLSIAVLGELKGLRMAHEMYGVLPWQMLFGPAINYAKNGFPVSRFLASDIQEYQKNIFADPGLRQVFAPNGKLLLYNETCYNRKLGETLEAVAEFGPDVLYNGPVGAKLVKDIQALGAIITMKDLHNYKPKVTDVFTADIRGYKILGMPPPSSGTVGVTMVANILENYGNLRTELNGPLGCHRITEALKHMLGMRMNLGDPAFVDVAPFVKEMTSKSFALKIWHRIFDKTTFPPPYYSYRWLQVKDRGTAHLSVVDKNRNAVALTSTINDSFGSKILSPSTGIILNSQMRDFSTPSQIELDKLPPSPQNYIQPGKRPLSSMTPLIILKDGQLAGVIGGSGGMYIPAAVTQTFINHFVLGMSPRSSVERPRVYPQLKFTDVEYDDMTTPDLEYIALPKEYQESLKHKHHKLKVVPYAVSCLVIVQDIKNNSTTKGLLTAIADPRKDGKPAAE